MWVTVRDYAIRQNIAVQTVYSKIKYNTIQHRKVKDLNKKDIIQIWIDDTPSNSIQPETTTQSDEAYNKAQLQKTELDNALKLEKLKNLQQDTLIKKQRQVFTKQQYRREYAEGVFQCFTQAFSTIKNMLIDLRLSKQDNAKFKRIFADCIKRFETRLKQYLAEQDKKEIQSSETETIE